jgi:TolB-like protein/Flp pilus assembly protein TadD
LSLFNELKRRNVFKVALAYIVVAWFVLQVADVVLNNITAPGWVFKVLMLFVAIGFPFAMIFAWAFEMTPEGLKRESEVDRSQSITHETGQKLNYTIIAVLVLALGYFAYDKFTLSVGREAALVEATTQAVSEQFATEEPAVESDNSIAVLPFVNMSSDEEQEYFSDGLSEELLNLLAKIPELRVTSRSSAFSYKGKDFKIADVGRELNVSNVLEGSVRKAGNKVRVTAQLIRVEGDVHVWSETYDRSLENIFEIQDEIAQAVVAQLKVKLLGAVPTVKETDPEAYSLFLQARHLSNLLTPSGWEKSNEIYEKVLALAPDYASAWAGMGRNYNNMSTFNVLPMQEGRRLALDASNKALAIDPENVMAMRNLSFIARAMDGDFVAAAQYMEHALALEPNNPNNIGAAATLVGYLGRLDEAIRLGQYTLTLDPVNPVGYLNLASMYVSAGRLDDAITTSQTAMSLSPGTSGAQYWIGEAHMRKGESESALAAFALEEDDEWRVKGTALASYELGRLTEFEALFTELHDTWGERWPIEIAHVYAWIGDTDSVFFWLEKERLVNGLGGVMIDPYFTGLHEDPRWQPLLEKAGLSAAQIKAIGFKVTLPH